MKRGQKLTDESGCAYEVREVMATAGTTLLVRLRPVEPDEVTESAQ